MGCLISCFKDEHIEEIEIFKDDEYTYNSDSDEYYNTCNNFIYRRHGYFYNAD